MAKFHRMISQCPAPSSPTKTKALPILAENSWKIETKPFPLLSAIVGGTNIKKWGDHQEKKFSIDNTAQAPIPFKEGHRSPPKLFVHLEEDVLVWEEGRYFPWSVKITSREAIKNLLEFFYLLAQIYLCPIREGPNEEKLGDKRIKRLFIEIWIKRSEEVKGGWEGCEDSERLFILTFLYRYC